MKPFSTFTVPVWQLLVLLSLTALATLPFLSPQIIYLRTAPRDPRDMLRGNYVQLVYEINRPAKDLLPKGISGLTSGQIVYLQLAGQDGAMTARKLLLEEPVDGVYIRGQVERSWKSYQEQGPLIKYGIEQYFLPKGEAMEVEKSIRPGALVAIYLGRGGRAAIKEMVK